MASTRRIAALLVLLCLSAAGGSPLPQEDPVDVLPEDDIAPQPQEAETAAPDTVENTDNVNSTAEEGADPEVTVEPAEGSETTEEGAEEDVEADEEGEGLPILEKRSPLEETQDSLKEDEFHILAKRHGELENHSENERRRREEGPSEGDLVPELVEGEEPNDDEEVGSTTQSSEDSSTDSAPTEEAESDQPVAEEVQEDAQVGALQSADEIYVEEETETIPDTQETTVKAVAWEDEAGETGVPSDESAPEAESEIASAESDIPDSRRRRRRVPLKEESGLDDQKQFSNDTEQQADDSVKSVALT